MRALVLRVLLVIAMTRRGAWVEVMGPRITVDDLTGKAGTIGYELLTRLGQRVHRVYEGQGA